MKPGLQPLWQGRSHHPPRHPLPQRRLPDGDRGQIIPVKMTEYDEQQRHEFEHRFRGNFRRQIISVVLPTLAHLVLLVLGIENGLFERYWPITAGAMLIGGIICRGMILSKDNRCPACDINFNFRKQAPNRKRKACPGCGSQLIN